MSESVRADVWVWSVRIYRTRSLATAACKAGHVTVNRRRAKPSQPIRVGDTVEALTPSGSRVYVVRRLLDKRVGFAAAVEAFEDHSPPPIPKPERPVVVARRDPGTGRPTKRDRRRLDAFRARSKNG